LLTAKEKLVAELVAKGFTNKEVAKQLAITDRTVKAHLTAVFDKLGVRDRVHLALLLKA
jgi:DNA-binding NarL/FixJ family response regulator